MGDPISKLALGLLTGFLFGFLLQKGHVSKYTVIVGQFLLRDFTVLKTMLTAIVVGGIGIYSFLAFGAVSLHIKPAQLAAVSLGGLIFGVGMVVLGYCPGTGVAAAAEGRRDAIAGLAGMLAGALLFSSQYAACSTSILKWHDLGPVTLPNLTSIPAWVFFAVLAIGVPFLFRWVERLEANARAAGR